MKMGDKIFSISSIEKEATELDFKVLSVTKDEIKIALHEDWVLVFQNMGTEDTPIFFDGNYEWHTHGSLFEGKSRRRSFVNHDATTGRGSIVS
jgi:hypothetical protein